MLGQAQKKNFIGPFWNTWHSMDLPVVCGITEEAGNRRPAV
jgi:hypothetical protein